MNLPRVSFWSLLSLLGILGSVTVLVIAGFLHPDPRGFGTHEQLGLAPCSSLALTGKPCLSCGMTTAFACMLHGRPVDSVRANPAGALLAVLALIAPFWFGHALLNGVDPLRFLNSRGGRCLLVGSGALAITVWLTRTLA